MNLSHRKKIDLVCSHVRRYVRKVLSMMLDCAYMRKLIDSDIRQGTEEYS